MKISKRTNQNGNLKQPVSENLDAVVERMGSKVNNNAGGNTMLLFGATFGKGGIDDVRTKTGLLLVSTVEAPMQTISQWQQQLSNSLTTADVPTLARLGRALKHMQYPEGAIAGVRGYYMKRR